MLLCIGLENRGSRSTKKWKKDIYPVQLGLAGRISLWDVCEPYTFMTKHEEVNLPGIENEGASV